jgi:hypothetical protein
MNGTDHINVGSNGKRFVLQKVGKMSYAMRISDADM